MTYNIDLEIGALFFLILLIIFHYIKYNNSSTGSSYYRLLLCHLLFANILEILTAICMSYASKLPLGLITIVYILYYVVSTLCTYFLILYVQAIFKVENDRKRYNKINKYLFRIFTILVVTSPFTKLLFYYKEDHTLYSGPLMMLLYLLPFYYMINAMGIVVKRRHEASTLQIVAMFIYALCNLGSLILQITVMHSYLIQYFVAAITAIILLFTMETPDYEKLVKTLEELKIARERAEEADKAKGIFLANMSHEIRTPINGILGMDEIALQENQDPKIDGYLVDIKNAGEGLLTIINDILDFTKLESGQLEIFPIKYSLEELVSDIEKIIKNKYAKSSIDFAINVDKDCPKYLVGDEIRLKQILINLLSNSFKYTKKGSVTLKISYTDIPDIDIETDSTNTIAPDNDDSRSIHLQFQVVDTGIGIAKEDQSKLFQAFQRIDLVKNRTIQGTGLGLRITKQIVELMNGSISVESIYNEGSTFTVIVPQQIAVASPTLAESNTYLNTELHDNNLEAPSQDKEIRILAVDDVSINLKVIVGLLKNTVYKVDTAESGEECLKLASENSYDCILLDHMMPNMDGIETLNRLKQLDSYTNNPYPIIVVTANAVVGAKEEYLEAGFTDYISKPVNRETLVNMLGSYISQSAM